MTQPIRCLLVDDEPLALQVIENYASRIEGLQVVGSCRSALAAHEMLQRHAVDALFLDIQMPMLTGMHFIKSLPNPPKVIFTTAFSEYAVESYEIDAVDYLIKPISFERFFKAYTKLQTALGLTHSQTHSHLPPPQAAIPPSTYEPFLYVKADKKTYRLLHKEILFIESLDDHVVVHTQTDAIQCYQNISHFQQQLPEPGFLRIHRAYLIAIAHVRAFTATTVEIGSHQLPIGRTYKEKSLSALSQQ